MSNQGKLVAKLQKLRNEYNLFFQGSESEFINTLGNVSTETNHTIYFYIRHKAISDMFYYPHVRRELNDLFK